MLWIIAVGSNVTIGVQFACFKDTEGYNMDANLGECLKEPQVRINALSLVPFVQSLLPYKRRIVVELAMFCEIR